MNADKMCGGKMKQLAFCVGWLALSLLVFTRPTRGEGEYQTVYACEGTTLELQCPAGQLIQLVRANFGRFSITICNTLGNTNWTVKCMTPNSLRVLQRSCGVSNICSVPITTDVFGDSCPGTSKYIEVQFQCVKAISTTTTSRPRPPWHALYPDPDVWLRNEEDDEKVVNPTEIKEESQPPTTSTLTAPTVISSDSSFDSSSTPSATDAVFESISEDISSVSSGEIMPDQKFNVSINSPNTMGGDIPDARIGNSGYSISSDRTTTFPSAATTSTEAVGKSKWLSSLSADGMDDSMFTPPPPSFASPPPVSDERPAVDPINYNQQQMYQNQNLDQTSHDIHQSSGYSAHSNNVPTSSAPSHCQWTSARGLLWPSTAADSQAVMPCPRGATGRARWQCDGSTGRWMRPTPNLSDCHSPAVSRLEHQLLSGSSAPLHVAAQLPTVSQPQGQVSLLGGDVRLMARLCGELASALSANLVDRHETNLEPGRESVRQLVMNVVQMISHLLDARQREAWFDLPPSERAQTVTRLLIGLEQVAFLLADYMTLDRSIVELSNHLYLSVLSSSKSRSGDLEYFQFPLTSPMSDWHNNGNSLMLSGPALPETQTDSPLRIVFTMYKGLEHLLLPESLPNAPLRYAINSAVISASLGEGRHVPLIQPVTIVLRHLIDYSKSAKTWSSPDTEAVYTPSCRYWDYASTAWLSDGCWLLETNNTHTTCQCSHLTHFAVLMEVRVTALDEISSNSSTVLVVVYLGGVMAVLGASFAMLALVVATASSSSAIVTCSGDIGYRPHWWLYKHLLFSVITAEVCLFLGLHQTDNATVCGILAGCLQFFLLSSLCWHALDVVLRYSELCLLQTVTVGDSGFGETESGRYTRRRCVGYCAAGYAVPLLVVAVGFAVDASKFGTKRHCWLALEHYFLLSFTVPAAISIMISLFLMGLCEYSIRRQRGAHITMATAKQRTLTAQRSELGNSFLLLVALVLFMTSALAYLEFQTPISAYLFTAANGALGVCVAAVLVIKNNPIRQVLKDSCLSSRWCVYGSDTDRGDESARTKAAMESHFQTTLGSGGASVDAVYAGSSTVNTMFNTADRRTVPHLWPSMVINNNNNSSSNNDCAIVSDSLRYPAGVPQLVAGYSMRRGSARAAGAVNGSCTMRNNAGLTEVSSIEPGMDSGHGTGSEHEESPHLMLGNNMFRSHTLTDNRIAATAATAAEIGAVNYHDNINGWSTLHGYRAPNDHIYHPSVRSAYHTYVEVDRDPQYEEIERQLSASGRQHYEPTPPPPAPSSPRTHHTDNFRRYQHAASSPSSPIAPVHHQFAATVAHQGFSRSRDQAMTVAMLEGDSVVCRMQSR